MSLDIRKANVGEFPRVRYFYHYCVKHTDEEHALMEVNEDLLQEAIQNEKVFLCFQYDTLVGALILDEKEREAWITHIAIHPAYFGKGMLNIMVQDALEKMRVNQVTKVHLFIPEGNIQTANMFVNFGFQPHLGNWYEYQIEE